MVALRDIPSDVWTLAFGCFRGNRERVLAVQRLAFEEATLDEAAPESGVSRSQLDRDRKLFASVLEQYKDNRVSPTMTERRPRRRETRTPCPAG
jgi:hypothetical protein